VDPYLAGFDWTWRFAADEGLNIDNELARLRAGMRLSLRGTPAIHVDRRIEATEGHILRGKPA